MTKTTVRMCVDPERSHLEGTGIFVRAWDGKWGSWDIAALDKTSLLNFLKSRDGDNRLAENCVGIILGHGHLHEDVQQSEGEKTE